MERSRPWKQSLVLSLAVAVALFVLTVASAKGEKFPPDITGIIERGKLVVAQFQGDRPPFFMADDSKQVSGFDSDLAKDIASYLEVDLELKRQAHTFDEVVDLVVRGEADIGISKLSITLRRALRARFTEPYLVLRKGLLINRLLAARTGRGSAPLELCNHPEARLGVLMGSSHAGFAKERFPQAQIVPYETFALLLDAVQNGEVLAIVSDDMQIKNLLGEAPGMVLKLRMVILEDEPDPIGIVTGIDSPHLISWLNLYLKKKTLNLTPDSLLERYRKGPSEKMDRPEEIGKGIR